MRLRATVFALIAFGAAAQALAASKLQMNIVPSPPDCYIGGACLNSGASCSDIGGNTDCVTAGVDPKSKVTLDGKLGLKASLKGVVDNTGALVTTGVEGAADNFVLQIGLQTCTP